MVKDQNFLEDKASQCLDLAKKFGATDCEVLVSNLRLNLLSINVLSRLAPLDRDNDSRALS